MAFRAAGAVAFEDLQDNIAAALPAGVVASDLLLCMLMASANLATITPSTGWTLVYRLNDDVVSCAAIFMAAGDAAAPSFDFGGQTCDVIAFTLAYTDIDPTNPLDVAAEGLLTVTGTECLAPSVTTITPSAQIVALHGSIWELISAWDSPWGTVRRSFSFDPASFETLSLAAIDGLQPAAGPSGTKSVTLTGSSSGVSTFLGITIALRSNIPPPSEPARGVALTQLMR